MKTLNDFLEKCENYSYEQIKQMARDELDEIYEPVELAGMTIYASEMKSIDPVMFRCYVADYCSENFTEHEGFYYLNDDYENAENDYKDYLESEVENE